MRRRKSPRAAQHSIDWACGDLQASGRSLGELQMCAHGAGKTDSLVPSGIIARFAASRHRRRAAQEIAARGTAQHRPGSRGRGPSPKWCRSTKRSENRYEYQAARQTCGRIDVPTAWAGNVRAVAPAAGALVRTCGRTSPKVRSKHRTEQTGKENQHLGGWSSGSREDSRARGRTLSSQLSLLPNVAARGEQTSGVRARGVRTLGARAHVRSARVGTGRRGSETGCWQKQS